jgi:hypothetical protein
MAVLYGVGIAVDIFMHGKPVAAETRNFWRGLVLTAVSALILHCGGFW